MTMEAMGFRPRTQEQREQILMLAWLLGTSITDVVLRGIDALAEKHAEALEQARPAYETAQAALAEARQAAQAVAG